MNWPTVPLGELCKMDRRGLRPDAADALLLPFVGVENVEAGSGAINLNNGGRVGSQKSTSFRFDERHVLYGKLRPYLNKVAIPAFAGKCSTELVPLLPETGVDREFLGYLLRRQKTVDYVMSSVTGARMPRTDMKALLSLPVPCPPLDEQRRIVGILNRAARIERLRKRARERLREFVSALFVYTFDDQEQIATRFPCMPLREVATIASGATKGRKIDPKNAAEVPYLRVANVQDGFLNLDEIKTMTIRCGEERKYALAPGDLVMTEGGDSDKLGRAAVWNGDLPYCAHQNHVFRVRPNRKFVLTGYLLDLVGSAYGKAYFLSIAKRTTGIASINKSQLGSFSVPIPSIELQNRYATHVAKVRCVADLVSASADQIEKLCASLMSRLFRGDA